MPLRTVIFSVPDSRKTFFPVLQTCFFREREEMRSYDLFPDTEYSILFKNEGVMADTIVKILECQVADSGLLRIDRIGAGVGVMLYSSANKTGAGLHILAPHSVSPQPKNPVMYANTAIPHALEHLQRKGAFPPYSIAIAGGAALLGKDGDASTGQKVVEAVKTALSQAALPVKVDQTGGSRIRSMILNIDEGKISIT